MAGWVGGWKGGRRGEGKAGSTWVSLVSLSQFCPSRVSGRQLVAPCGRLGYDRVDEKTGQMKQLQARSQGCHQPYKAERSSATLRALSEPSNGRC